jgi:hypothetical protein
MSKEIRELLLQAYDAGYKDAKIQAAQKFSLMEAQEIGGNEAVDHILEKQELEIDEAKKELECLTPHEACYVLFHWVTNLRINLENFEILCELIGALPPDDYDIL